MSAGRHFLGTADSKLSFRPAAWFFGAFCISQIGLLEDSIPGNRRLGFMDPHRGDSFRWPRSKLPCWSGDNQRPISCTGQLRYAGFDRTRPPAFSPGVGASATCRRSQTGEEACLAAFSENVAEHLAWESFAAVRNAEIIRASRGLRTLFRLHPGALAHLVRNWTRASTIATLVAALGDREKLPNARAQFKQLRSDIPRR